MGTGLSSKALREATRLIDWLAANGIDRAEAQKQILAFAETLQPQRKKKPKDGPTVDTSEFMAVYRAEFEEIFKETPNFTGKDFAMAAKLLKQYGVPLCVQRVRFLATQVRADQFWRRLGFTIGTLTSQWNRLATFQATAMRVVVQPAPSDCRHTPKCQSALQHSQQVLRDVRDISPARTLSRRTI